MRIAVMIKQVPASNEIFLDPVTHNIIRDGKKAVINPYDRFALELALQLKDEFSGEIHVYTMGILAASAILREALSLGADRAFLLSDRAFAGADTLATAYTLHLAIEKTQTEGHNYDLILCGRMAIDGDTAQIGPELAEHLNLAHISDVNDIVQVNNEQIIVKRRQDHEEQIIAGPYPLLLTIDKDINQPRLPNLDGVIAAFDKEIENWNALDLQADLNRCGLKGSPTRVVKVEVPLRENNCQFLLGSAQEIAVQLNALSREVLDKSTIGLGLSDNENLPSLKNLLIKGQVIKLKEHDLEESELSQLENQFWVLGQIVEENKIHPVTYELLAKAKNLAKFQEIEELENSKGLNNLLDRGRVAEDQASKNKAYEQNNFENSFKEQEDTLITELRPRTKVGLILPNRVETEEVLAKALASGADFIFNVEGNPNNVFDSNCDFLERLVKIYSPRIILTGATDWGRSIAPRLAARLKTGLTADCTELSIVDNLLRQTRPAFGGNMLATIICPNHKPQMATVRPGIYKTLLAEQIQEERPEVISPEKEEVKNYKKYIIDCLPGEKHNETLKLLSRRALDRGQDLQTARVLFVAGLGIGSKRNLQTMIDLANSLGIGWGVSRPLVDIGWAEHSRQIGQTGQIVSPDLLISFGVSGAIQHLAGISKSKAIIAINHDETAPIFNSASLGVVADCSEVLKVWFRNKNIMKK